MATKPQDHVHGEGNYEASRQYNDATKKFVESGRVEQAARDAAPQSPAEATEMKQAEQAALLRAKEKEPPIKEPEPREPAVDEPGPTPQEKEAKNPSTTPARSQR